MNADSRNLLGMQQSYIKAAEIYQLLRSELKVTRQTEQPLFLPWRLCRAQMPPSGASPGLPRQLKHSGSTTEVGGSELLSAVVLL